MPPAGSVISATDPPREADRGVAHLLAGAERQGGGVVQQDQVDVGRIVELVTAELAERDGDEASVGCPAFGERRGDARIERSVGEGRQRRRHPLERPRPRQVGERDDQRDIGLGAMRSRSATGSAASNASAAASASSKPSRSIRPRPSRGGGGSGP